MDVHRLHSAELSDNHLRLQYLELSNIQRTERRSCSLNEHDLLIDSAVIMKYHECKTNHDNNHIQLDHLSVVFIEVALDDP